MRAECKTKNEVFGFAYAECSQTYEKFVQGMFAIFSEPPPNFGLSKVKQMRAECSQTYEKLSKRKQKDSDRTGVIYV